MARQRRTMVLPATVSRFGSSFAIWLNPQKGREKKPRRWKWLMKKLHKHFSKHSREREKERTKENGCSQVESNFKSTTAPRFVFASVVKVPHANNVAISDEQLMHMNTHAVHPAPTCGCNTLNFLAQRKNVNVLLIAEAKKIFSLIWPFDYLIKARIHQIFFFLENSPEVLHFFRILVTVNLRSDKVTGLFWVKVLVWTSDFLKLLVFCFWPPERSSS